MCQLLHVQAHGNKTSAITLTVMPSHKVDEAFGISAPTTPKGSTDEVSFATHASPLCSKVAASSQPIESSSSFSDTATEKEVGFGDKEVLFRFCAKQ